MCICLLSRQLHRGFCTIVLYVEWSSLCVYTLMHKHKHNHKTYTTYTYNVHNIHKYAYMHMHAHTQQALDMLQRLCEIRSYGYLRLDGSTPASKRMSLVERFNSKYSNECKTYLKCPSVFPPAITCLINPAINVTSIT